LLLGLGCRPEPASQSAAPAAIEVDATVHASQIRADLTQAQKLWAADQREEAREEALRSWSEHFAPIDDRLRAHDPDGTLALEYAYGRLVGHLSRRGEAGAIATEIRKLSDNIDKAVAALPLPAPADGAEAGLPPPGGPATGTPGGAPLPSGPRPVSMPAPPLPGGKASPPTP
jgi:hypothetical protein